MSTAVEQSESAAHGAPPAARRRWTYAVATAVALLWIALTGLAGATGFAKLGEVETTDQASFLPVGTESTRVLEVQRSFRATDLIPAVIVYERTEGITDADRAVIATHLERLLTVKGVVAPAPPPVPSQDGRAVQLLLPYEGDFETLPAGVANMQEIVAADRPAGLQAYVTGPAGVQGAFGEAFEGIDGTLLFTALGVVAVILLVVYRSLLLPLLVLASASTALVVAGAVVYLLARNDILDVNGQSRGIMSVLVIGAGTDYALLLVARYREELHRHESRVTAIIIAWKRAAPAILASGATVILGLMCLLLSNLSSNAGLGPVGSLGIAGAMLAMLVFLPAALLILGRATFWPFKPGYGTPPRGQDGVWARVSGLVGRRPRLVWIGTTLLLVALASGVFQLRAGGLTQADQFTTETEAITGQTVLARHFPAGSGSATVVVGPAEQADALVNAVRSVPGVVDAQLAAVPGPGSPVPQAVNGRVQIEATLAAEPVTSEAKDTVLRLRSELDRVTPEALVGGDTAIDMDVQAESRRDRQLIIPAVLVVIFLVLVLLLRALVAPLLLIATVVLSFAATLGVCAVVFNNVFNFAGADTSFPLFAFVFLVALGIDYNIFLMTRVREEAAQHGTSEGVLRGLRVTGGVITSAGVVLAATFAALAILPLVFLAELGFAVAFGVLLDTLLVRSLLVPALSHDLGRWTWWPDRLAGDRTPAP